MWRQISLVKPPEGIQVLFGYYDSNYNKITRVEDGIYEHPVLSCMWANVWMEVPTTFKVGHL